MNSGIGILRELADTLEEEAKQVAEMEAELTRLRAENETLQVDAALGRAVRKEMERLQNIRDDDNSLLGLGDAESDFLSELESLNQTALQAAGLMEVEEK